MNRLFLASLFAVVALGWFGAPVSAQECETDEDCPDWMACEPGGMATADCRPGEACDAGAPEVLPGECRPQEIECETDADCPAGLYCEEQRAGEVACTAPAPGADASVACEPEQPAPPVSVCTFEPAECETDADCEQEGFGCLEVEQGGGESCTGGGPICEPDTECPEPEVVCVQEPSSIIRYCFPERVDCTEDSECAADWVCGALYEKAQDHPPTGWEGATTVCLPEGLALIFSGQIRAGSGGEASSEYSSVGMAGTGAELGESAAGSGGSDGADSSDQSGSTYQCSDSDGGGCAVASARGGGGTALLPLALLAVAAFLASRRRRG